MVPAKLVAFDISKFRLFLLLQTNSWNSVTYFAKLSWVKASLRRAVNAPMPYFLRQDCLYS